LLVLNGSPANDGVAQRLRAIAAELAKTETHRCDRKRDEYAGKAEFGELSVLDPAFWVEIGSFVIMSLSQLSLQIHSAVRSTTGKSYWTLHPFDASTGYEFQLD